MVNFKQSFQEHEFDGTAKQPLLLDTTLRDGEQSPGIYFTISEKIMLAKALDSLGIDIIEAGIPGMGKEEKQVFCELQKLDLKAEILAWNRLVIDDVKSSLDAGITKIHVSIPTSPQHLLKKLGKEQLWVFRQMDKVISFAKDNGMDVSLGAEDASRTSLEFLNDVFQHAQILGVKRLRYADTLGILTPYETCNVIGKLTGGLSIPLDFHGHNDFGMATANAVCAWKAGAEVISCSILGLGERAGNTTLEEFVGCMHFLGAQYENFDFLALRNLCEIVSFIINRPIPVTKPLFGREIFRHESGIHVDGLLKDNLTYEYFAPEKVGGKRDLVIGKHSGRSAVKFLASRKKRDLTDTQAQEFLMVLRKKMAEEKGVEAELFFEKYLETLKN